MGTGHPGMADGEIQQVEFDSPHGLVEFNSCIYVADTNNHAIRVVRTIRKNKVIVLCLASSSIRIHAVFLH